MQVRVLLIQIDDDKLQGCYKKGWNVHDEKIGKK